MGISPWRCRDDRFKPACSDTAVPPGMRHKNKRIGGTGRINYDLRVLRPGRDAAAESTRISVPATPPAGGG
jgi:hypothetical protein